MTNNIDSKNGVGDSKKPTPANKSSVVKSLPPVTIKRSKNGWYRVYKRVGDRLIVKKTFPTMHMARRYVKGFKR